MSVEVIGHEPTRTALASHAGSFALLGPSGVGRSLIVREWTGGRPFEKIDFGLLHQAFVPGVVYTVDADTQDVPWERLLRPLEEGRLLVAITATHLPDPVLTRLQVFRVGLLSDFEVSRVLQVRNKLLQPRQLIAQLLGGTLDNLELAVGAAKTLETLNGLLAAGRFDGTVRFPDYRAVLFALQAAASTALGVLSLPFSPDALARLPWGEAFNLLELSVDRLSESEARNAVVRFLRRTCG